jgi:hypothetical protein
MIIDLDENVDVEKRDHFKGKYLVPAIVTITGIFLRGLPATCNKNESCKLANDQLFRQSTACNPETSMLIGHSKPWRESLEQSRSMRGTVYEAIIDETESIDKAAYRNA